MIVNGTLPQSLTGGTTGWVRQDRDAQTGKFAENSKLLAGFQDRLNSPRPGLRANSCQSVLTRTGCTSPTLSTSNVYNQFANNELREAPCRTKDPQVQTHEESVSLSKSALAGPQPGYVLAMVPELNSQPISFEA